jgi:hypothetical protein
MGNMYKILDGKPEGRYGRIILKQIFGKVLEAGIGIIWLRTGTGGGLL